MTRERQHEYDDDDREPRGSAAAEGTPGKHTLTAQLSRPLIHDSVGAGGRNDRRDVGIVQRALARHGHSPGAIDQIVGKRTINAIRRFQATLRMQPDGLIEVDRKTERALRRGTQKPATLPRPTPAPREQAAPTEEPEVEQPQAEPARDAGESANASKHAPGAGESAAADPQAPVAGDPRGKIAELHPALQQRARALLAEAQRRGLSVLIFEGMRDMDRQNQLYAQGRTAPGKVVTWVRGGGSYHNYGLAIDVVFQGKQPWGEQHDWKALGACGEAAGLEWGGRWKNADRPHFQIAGHTISELKGWYANGGLDNVWKRVRDSAGATSQPVAEDYDEQETTKAGPEADDGARGGDRADASPATPTDAPAKPTAAPPTTPRAAAADPVLAAVERFRPFIEEAAATYGIDPDHLRAIMAVESKGDPNATSGAAFGLMQITRGTWDQTRKTEPALQPYAFESSWRDPRINTLFGAAVLKTKARTMGVSGSDDGFAALAITAYNAGEGTVKTAIALAKDAGSAQPTKDFLHAEFLKPAIAKYNLHSYYLTNAKGKQRNKSGTEEEALDLKYREIVRYVPQVETYLDKLSTDSEGQT